MGAPHAEREEASQGWPGPGPGSAGAGAETGAECGEPRLGGSGAVSVWQGPSSAPAGAAGALPRPECRCPCRAHAWGACRVPRGPAAPGGQGSAGGAAARSAQTGESGRPLPLGPHSAVLTNPSAPACPAWRLLRTHPVVCVRPAAGAGLSACCCPGGEAVPACSLFYSGSGFRRCGGGEGPQTRTRLRPPSPGKAGFCVPGGPRVCHSPVGSGRQAHWADFPVAARGWGAACSPAGRPSGAALGRRPDGDVPAAPLAPPVEGSGSASAATGFRSSGSLGQGFPGASTHQAATEGLQGG